MENIDPTYAKRESAIQGLLLVLKDVTIPIVREKAIAEYRLLVATHQEMCRRANITYIPPVIPDPPKPPVETVYESVILQCNDNVPLLAHIVYKNNMDVWQAQLFCFFSTLRCVNAGSVPKAVLEIAWNEVLQSIRSFKNKTSFISLQKSPLYEMIFKEIESLSNMDNIRNLTDVIRHTSENGLNFVVCSNSQRCFSLWLCNNDFLLIYTNIHNAAGLITGTVDELGEKLKSFQSYIFCQEEFSVVKVVKKK